MKWLVLGAVVVLVIIALRPWLLIYSFSCISGVLWIFVLALAAAALLKYLSK